MLRNFWKEVVIWCIIGESYQQNVGYIIKSYIFAVLFEKVYYT